LAAAPTGLAAWLGGSNSTSCGCKE
jgi:hypothetical protein